MSRRVEAVSMEARSVDTSALCRHTSGHVSRPVCRDHRSGMRGMLCRVPHGVSYLAAAARLFGTQLNARVKELETV